MHIGFIGLGNMGFPIARRLVEAGHKLVVFDTRKEAVDKLVARGATAAPRRRTSPIRSRRSWRACPRCRPRSRSPQGLTA
ncbi:6-phosphogluconate dehydrogenase (decarboxylating) [Bradyrhizobium barranii subsp. barranii]